MTTVYEIKEPLCMFCARAEGYPFDSCEAFPLGIPGDIWKCRFDHHNPWPESDIYPLGDRGLQFKPID